MAHAHYMRDTSGCKHTLRMCNAHCLSTATKVARTRFSVSLHVHCLSCFLSQAVLYTFNFFYWNKTDTTVRACNCLFVCLCVCVCGVLYYISLTWCCSHNVNRHGPYIVKLRMVFRTTVRNWFVTALLPQNFKVVLCRTLRYDLGRDGPISIATFYGLDVLGIESLWGRDFPHPPDGSWVPPNVLYNGYRVFTGDKAAGAWPWPPTHIWRRSWRKSRVLHLPILVFLACCRVNVTFALYLYCVTMVGNPACDRTFPGSKKQTDCLWLGFLDFPWHLEDGTW
jgi:hypothetical protein